MAKPTGFMEYPRQEQSYPPAAERVKHYREFALPLPADKLNEQAARCMDCGIPFCHSGCPVFNRIPEFNDLVYRDKWREAIENLHSTNNFPEITGRVCPAPCEASCTLNIQHSPVSIKHIELQIIEHAFAEGWVVPRPPDRKTSKRAAIVGSGPAGLAAAQQLARAGHDVTVFEKDDRIGGLLRYGIPDFKLEKHIIDRRLEQLEAEGVTFEAGVEVGLDVSARYLRKMFDAICLCMGAGQPRTLDAPGAEAGNVRFAMDFLTQQNRRVAGDPEPPPEQVISARDKVVVVIGGGDTGSDCVGTSVRQGAKQVHQWEILPQPPEGENPATPWPMWPQIMRTSTSHQEGCTRRWSVLTKELAGSGGLARRIRACEADWSNGPNGWEMKERPGTEFTKKADLILLAMGFVHVVHGGLIEQLGLKLDQRGNIVIDDYMTSEQGIFAAGDTALGASLVVRAIYQGREAAAAMDRYLTG